MFCFQNKRKGKSQRCSFLSNEVKDSFEVKASGRWWFNLNLLHGITSWKEKHLVNSWWTLCWAHNSEAARNNITNARHMKTTTGSNINSLNSATFDVGHCIATTCHKQEAERCSWLSVESCQMFSQRGCHGCKNQLGVPSACLKARYSWLWKIGRNLSSRCLWRFCCRARAGKQIM